MPRYLRDGSKTSRHRDPSITTSRFQHHDIAIRTSRAAVFDDRARQRPITISRSQKPTSHAAHPAFECPTRDLDTHHARPQCLISRHREVNIPTWDHSTPTSRRSIHDIAFATHDAASCGIRTRVVHIQTSRLQITTSHIRNPTS